MLKVQVHAEIWLEREEGGSRMFRKGREYDRHRQEATSTKLGVDSTIPRMSSRQSFIQGATIRKIDRVEGHSNNI